MCTPVLLACAGDGAPIDLQDYLELARARADVLLKAHGVANLGQAVAVRAWLSAGGGLTGLQILRSAGAPGVDRMVGHVLRKVLLADPAVGLAGGSITLSLGASPSPAKVAEASRSPRRVG